MARPYAALVLSSALLGGCASVQDTLYDTGVAVARWRAGLVAKEVTIDGQTVAYLERPARGGDPSETVVLLHGFAGSKDLWLLFTARLHPRYRVLALDLPGHGDSTRNHREPYSPSTLTMALIRAVDRLAPGPVHLAGASLGGLVTTLYAIECPGRVATLGLFAPLGVYPPVASELQRRLVEGDNPLLVESTADFDRLIDFIFVEAPFMPWPVRPVLARRYVLRASINRAIWNGLEATFLDVRDRLPAIRAPVFIQWGSADRVLHVSSIDVYAAMLARLEVHVIDNSGHVPMVEHTAQSADAYQRFLTEHALSAVAVAQSRTVRSNVSPDCTRGADVPVSR